MAAKAFILIETSVGKTKLELVSGDIAQLEVDAVVVPADTELWMDHGVAAAVEKFVLQA